MANERYKHSANRMGLLTAYVSLVLSLTLLAGCAPPRKKTYSPLELRAAIEKTTDEAPTRVVVPFEVAPKYVEMARRLTLMNQSRSERARALMQALFDPEYFGLKYADVATRTATETLESGGGNCMSLASVFVGLARGIGLKAHYLDASGHVEQVHHDEDVVVRSGHVTAVVETENGKSAMDFGQRIGPFIFHRMMDDMEATAHFYNNRGYEIIYSAQQSGLPVDWAEVARNFRIATQVRPEFVRAWNNLGVANARLGRPHEATASYLKAISLDPDFASPHTNLGILRLAQGDIKGALASFDRAAELDPGSPRTHFHRGLALDRAGETERAIEALKAAIREQEDFSKARKLLGKILRRENRHQEAERFDPAPRATKGSE